MRKWRDLAELLALEKNVLVISTTLFVMVTGYFSWYLLLPIYLRQLGATGIQVGLSYAVLTISYSAMQLVGGMLADRWGRKPLIVVPTFSAGLLYALVSMSPRWQILLVFLVLVNCLSALQWPAFLSMLSESVSPRRRGAAFSLMELFIVLGITVGPALGAVLLPRIGFPGLILGTAILALPCGLVRSVFLRETGSPVASGEKLVDFRFFQRRHGSFLMGAVFLALTLTLTVYGPFIALYANDVIGLVESRINLMFALGGLAAVSFSLLGGRIIDQIGGKKVLLFCLLVFPLMFVGWTQTRGFLPSTVGYVMGYLFFHTTNISYQIQLTSVAPSAHRGSLVGTFGSVSGVISAAGPVLGSLLVSTVGQAGPFYGALVFALLAVYFFSRSPDSIGDG